MNQMMDPRESSSYSLLSQLNQGSSMLHSTQTMNLVPPPPSDFTSLLNEHLHMQSSPIFHSTQTMNSVPEPLSDFTSSLNGYLNMLSSPMLHATQTINSVPHLLSDFTSSLNGHLNIQSSLAFHLPQTINSVPHPPSNFTSSPLNRNSTLDTSEPTNNFSSQDVNQMFSCEQAPAYSTHAEYQHYLTELQDYLKTLEAMKHYLLPHPSDQPIYTSPTVTQATLPPFASNHFEPLASTDICQTQVHAQTQEYDTSVAFVACNSSDNMVEGPPMFHMTQAMNSVPPPPSDFTSPFNRLDISKPNINETQPSTEESLKLAREREGCKGCNCKKSKCLQLYCECFSAGVYCTGPCSCQDCFNNPTNEDIVLRRRAQIKSRDPLAFTPKVIRSSDSLLAEVEDDPAKTPTSPRLNKGCNCKKTSCQKKYCECYKSGVGCSISCKCEGCANTYGKKTAPAQIEDSLQIETQNIEGQTDYALHTSFTAN